MKNKRVIFLGLILGVLCGALFLGNIALFKMGSHRFLNLLDRSDEFQKKQFGLLLKEFRLSFEHEGEMGIFQAQRAGIQVSDKFATHGKKSLLIEFPPITGYPGITFDLPRKYIMDWSQMNEFTFDAYNTVDKRTNIIIQIRSGEKYPKRQFKKEVRLNGKAHTKVVIPIRDMSSKLDLDKISHLTIFMNKPKTTFRIFIDNIRVVGDESR